MKLIHCPRCGELRDPEKTCWNFECQRFPEHLIRALNSAAEGKDISGEELSQMLDQSMSEDPRTGAI